MSSVQDREKAQAAKEKHELKQRACKFYKENGVPEKMEEILNAMFYDNPDDVFGHLANYFERFAKPAKISKLKAREAVDSRGQPTVQTNVFCTYKNNEHLVCSVMSCTESFPSDASKSEDVEAGDKERRDFVSMAIDHINTRLGPALAWHEPSEQQALDTMTYNLIQKLVEEEQEKLAAEKEESGEVEQVESPAGPGPVLSPSASKGKVKSPRGKKGGPAVVIIPDEPREKYFCGCNAISAVSQAVCVAGAKTKDVPLYQHVAEFRFGEVPRSYRLPLPMVSILASGKGAPGKLNCVKEFMVVPRPGMPFKQSVKYAMEIYNQCIRAILSKPGQPPQKSVNDAGALLPNFDRPEQGLDMIQDAMTHLDLTPGEDFHIALNCAGHETFDYDKGKYEVMTGTQKTAEDLADFWAELLGKYPSIIALIDPMRKQEKEAWSLLCERLSDKCYVIGNKVFHRPGLLKDEELDADFRTSGVVLKMEHVNTVTDVLAAAKRMEDLGNQLVVGASYGDNCETFLADMAVGMNARFLKMGAPCRGEKVAKLNRLLEIESELEEQGKLEQWAEHEFPLLKPPTPPPEGSEEGDGGEKEESVNEDAKK